MLPFKNLLKIDKTIPEAVFRQIAAQLVLLIQKGTLMPNMPLPSTRSLAIELGLHRKTIMAAYNELITEDWIIGKERKEYRVSALLPIIKPRTYGSESKSNYRASSLFSFDKLEYLRSLPKIADDYKVIIDDGFPDVNLFPIEKVSVAYRQLLTHQTLKKASSNWNIGGSVFFKEVMSLFLNNTRGLNIESENIMITRGAQMAIYVAASLIIKPGDKVLVTTPNYFMADAIFKQLGAELVTVPVDDEGIDTNAVEKVLTEHVIKLLYIIPHHHHPTTVTLTATRRTKLLQLIRTHQLPVIEDDYDFDFQYQSSPYLPLASGHHNGNVIYIGSLTKVLGPNFRLGYIVSTTDFLFSATKLKSLIDLRNDSLIEGVVASLLQSGEFSRLIRKANKLYGYRCNHTAELINSELSGVVELKKPQGGMAHWLKFNERYSLPDIINKAANLGLQLTGSTYFKGGYITYDAIRFGFASVNDQEVEVAINILKKITTN